MPTVEIDRIDEFELESIHDHFIHPDQLLSTSKCEASVKSKAVGKGLFEESEQPIENFENAEEPVSKYTTSYTNATHKSIYKALGLLGVSDLSSPALL